MQIPIETALIEQCFTQLRQTRPYLSESERVQVQGLLRQTMVARSADREAWEAMRRVLRSGQERRLEALARRRHWRLGSLPGKKKRCLREEKKRGLALLALRSRKKRGIRTLLGGR